MQCLYNHWLISKAYCSSAESLYWIDALMDPAVVFMCSRVWGKYLQTLRVIPFQLLLVTFALLLSNTETAEREDKMAS